MTADLKTELKKQVEHKGNQGRATARVMDSISDLLVLIKKDNLAIHAAMCSTWITFIIERDMDEKEGDKLIDFFRNTMQDLTEKMSNEY
jgi:hypothetical protein